MVTNKRSKDTRQRGSTSHGCGSMKKRRGAGHRGGRGNAGSGKRGDSKKPTGWKTGKKFGKHGFISKKISVKIKSINIKSIEDRIQGLVKKGQAKFQNGAYYINLEDIGYNKLLSTGNVTKKYMITTLLAVGSAIEKIKQAGGNVTVTQETKKPAEKAESTADNAETSEEEGSVEE